MMLAGSADADDQKASIAAAINNSASTPYTTGSTSRVASTSDCRRERRRGINQAWPILSPAAPDKYNRRQLERRMGGNERIESTAHTTIGQVSADRTAIATIESEIQETTDPSGQTTREALQCDRHVVADVKPEHRHVGFRAAQATQRFGGGRVHCFELCGGIGTDNRQYQLRLTIDQPTENEGRQDKDQGCDPDIVGVLAYRLWKSRQQQMRKCA
ncbi:MAG: hypothetical protein R3E72_12415 [Steroidobacteraceae bacterium]